MSWVSNVLVSFEIEDRAAVETFNQWLMDEAPRRDGVPGTGVGNLADLAGSNGSNWGGRKYPECRLWAGALNHADLGAVVAKFSAVPWRVPAAAQLFIQDQEQSHFRVWMIRDGRVAQYSPDPPADETAW
jgi:hypothetical protein